VGQPNILNRVPKKQRRAGTGVHPLKVGESGSGRIGVEIEGSKGRDRRTVNYKRSEKVAPPGTGIHAAGRKRRSSEVLEQAGGIKKKEG